MLEVLNGLRTIDRKCTKEDIRWLCKNSLSYWGGEYL